MIAGLIFFLVVGFASVIVGGFLSIFFGPSVESFVSFVFLCLFSIGILTSCGLTYYLIVGWAEILGW